MVEAPPAGHPPSLAAATRIVGMSGQRRII